MEPSQQTPKSSSSTLLKVFLIGCIGLVVIAVVAFTAMFYYGKKWVKEKAEKIENVGGGENSEYGKRATKLKEEHPFTAPEDRVITESQLVRFLAVRKAVYGVYKQHEPEMKALENQNQGFSEAMKGLELINELKLVQVKELENQNMSPDEYTYIVTAVYSSWFAKAAKEGLKEHANYTDAANDALQKQIDELDKQIQDPNTPEESKEQLQQLKDTLETQKKTLGSDESLKQADTALENVPQANIDLFTKYQDEIQKYSMAGLEFVGL